MSSSCLTIILGKADFVLARGRHVIRSRWASGLETRLTLPPLSYAPFFPNLATDVLWAMHLACPVNFTCSDYTGPSYLQHWVSKAATRSMDLLLPCLPDHIQSSARSSSDLPGGDLAAARVSSVVLTEPSVRPEKFWPLVRLPICLPGLQWSVWFRIGRCTKVLWYDVKTNTVYKLHFVNSVGSCFS